MLRRDQFLDAEYNKEKMKPGETSTTHFRISPKVVRELPHVAERASMLFPTTSDKDLTFVVNGAEIRTTESNRPPPSSSSSSQFA
jgi:hypothetical protein